jgi:hypothetical protein
MGVLRDVEQQVPSRPGDLELLVDLDAWCRTAMHLLVRSA